MTRGGPPRPVSLRARGVPRVMPWFPPLLLPAFCARAASFLPSLPSYFPIVRLIQVQTDTPWVDPTGKKNQRGLSKTERWSCSWLHRLGFLPMGSGQSRQAPPYCNSMSSSTTSTRVHSTSTSFQRKLWFFELVSNSPSRAEVRGGGAFASCGLTSAPVACSHSLPMDRLPATLARDPTSAHICDTDTDTDILCTRTRPLYGADVADISSLLEVWSRVAK